MERLVFYTIDHAQVCEDKAEVRRALKTGAAVTKTTRISYRTGLTQATITTVTRITHSKDL